MAYSRKRAAAKAPKAEPQPKKAKVDEEKTVYVYKFVPGGGQVPYPMKECEAKAQSLRYYTREQIDATKKIRKTPTFVLATATVPKPGNQSAAQLLTPDAVRKIKKHVDKLLEADRKRLEEEQIDAFLHGRLGPAAFGL